MSNTFYQYIKKIEANKKPKGRKNKTINPEFIKICKFEKGELKNHLGKELRKYYNNVISKDGFLFVKGKDKVVLTAHMDTTPTVEYGKRNMIKDFYEEKKDGKHILSSPQGIGGDDRCGIYMIMEILKTTNLRPSIIFCEDEEIGCVGSNKFSNSKFIEDIEDNYFVIELDRRGSNDLVFYDDENDEFHNWCEKVTEYKEAYGSCSDISYICPASKISGVNISCGYHDEHHSYETVVLEEMQRTLETTIKLIAEGLVEAKQYEYKEKVYYRNPYTSYGWDYDYQRLNTAIGNYNSNSTWNVSKNRYKSTWQKETIKDKVMLWIEWDNGWGDFGHEFFEGETEADAWFNFFTIHANIPFENVTDYELYDDEVMYTKASE